MLLRGCIVINEDNVELDAIEEVFEELDIQGNVENEELGIIGGEEPYTITGNEDDFLIISKEKEYRCIHDNAIDEIYEEEAKGVYDISQWKEAVQYNNTTEGYDDWFEEMLDERDYGNFFSSYDGSLEESKNYSIFRTM